MTAGLGDEILRRRPFASRGEEAYLALQRTAYLLECEHARFLRPFGLTPTQYNALRILRGVHPAVLACGEVGALMVTPVPDVTRLLGRLEGRRLVRRRRSAADRRVVAVAITGRGLELLAALDEPLVAWLEERLGGLGEGRLAELGRLLAALRREPHRRAGPG